jgi:rod shape-determining protein MreC
MLKRQHFTALILVVLFVAVLTRLPSQTLGNVKLAIGGMFLPLFGLANSSHQVAEKAVQSIKSRSQLLRENEEWGKANQEMYMRLQADEAVREENAKLRQLIGWQAQSRNKYKLARVVLRDPANWWRSVQINLGSRDGIVPNLPVRTTDGLVGRIQSVGETRSQVILLGDPNLQVSAMVSTNGEKGVIVSSSSSPQENNMVDLWFLSGNTQVRPGQDVTTSGDGGIFPPNIPIGRTVDLKSKDYGVSKEARVKLFANFGALEEVWVVLP